ncbi:MAG: hypothetical protein Q8O94_02770 [bacterium]|nr:hypothetical protein [bacterium]
MALGDVLQNHEIRPDRLYTSEIVMAVGTRVRLGEAADAAGVGGSQGTFSVTIKNNSGNDTSVWVGGFQELNLNLELEDGDVYVVEISDLRSVAIETDQNAAGSSTVNVAYLVLDDSDALQEAVASISMMIPEDITATAIVNLTPLPAATNPSRPRLV